MRTPGERADLGSRRLTDALAKGRRYARASAMSALGDGQDRARRVAEHVLADGAQDPRYPVARRQDNELGVHCLGDADQGASGQVRDDPVFHPLRRVAECVA